MSYLNDWHDFVRVVVFLISIYCCVTLVNRYRKNSSRWNPKTLDYWYALLAWSVVGVVGSIQGIYFDLPFSPGVVVTTAAALVTGKGLHQKGSWGGDS